MAQLPVQPEAQGGALVDTGYVGAPLYAQRDVISAVVTAVFFATVVVGVGKPDHQEIVAFKETIVNVELAEPIPEPETPPPPPPEPTPQTPPPPAPRPTPAPAPQRTEPSPDPLAPVAPPVQAAPTPPAPPQPPTPPQPPAPPPPPAPARPAAPSMISVQDRYEAGILGYIESIKRYPTSREARQSRPEGTVTVWFELNREGKLVDVGIEKSAGSSLLDQQAITTLRRASFAPFPEGAYPGRDKVRLSANLQYDLKPAE